MATKYVDGVIVALTEIEAETLVMGQPAPGPTPEERIATLEEALNMLLSGVTE